MGRVERSATKVAKDRGHLQTNSHTCTRFHLHHNHVAAVLISRDVASEFEVMAAALFRRTELQA